MFKYECDNGSTRYIMVDKIVGIIVDKYFYQVQVVTNVVHSIPKEDGERLIKEIYENRY